MYDISKRRASIRRWAGTVFLICGLGFQVSCHSLELKPFPSFPPLSAPSLKDQSVLVVFEEGRIPDTLNKSCDVHKYEFTNLQFFVQDTLVTALGGTVRELKFTREAPRPGHDIYLSPSIDVDMSTSMLAKSVVVKVGFLAKDDGDVVLAEDSFESKGQFIVMDDYAEILRPFYEALGRAIPDFTEDLNKIMARRKAEDTPSASAE